MEDKYKLVEELNGEIFDLMGQEFLDKNIFYFSFTTDGFSEGINFNEMILWTSESEDREWDEDKNDYTPNLKTHLLDKLGEIASNINVFLIEQQEQC